MANTSVTMQAHRHPAEGMALTWEAVPGASRYGFVVGFAGIPVPPLDQIMRGAAPGFALAGIPARFSGAIDLGSPSGEELQYGLVVYRGDGTLMPVTDVHCFPASKKPEDRDYYPLHLPPLQRPAPVESPPTPPPRAPAQHIDTGGSPSPSVAARSVAAPGATEPLRPQPASHEPLPSPETRHEQGVTPGQPELLMPPGPVTAGGTQQRAGVTQPPAAAQQIVDSAEAPDPATDRATAKQDEGTVQEGQSVQDAAPVDARGVRVRVVPGPLASLGLSVRTLLDAAELSLQPAWSDTAEAIRLLDEVAAIAPRDHRLKALRGRAEEARTARAEGGVQAVMLQARQCLDNKDYWAAVRHYEQVLARRSHDDEAKQGMARARALGRWSAQMAGATADPRRLGEIGDAFAMEAPDLAAQAYEAAFRHRPTAAALQGWLLGLIQSGQHDRVPAAARAGVQALPYRDGAEEEPAREEALNRVAHAAGTAGAEEEVTRLVTLVAAALDEQGQRR